MSKNITLEIGLTNIGPHESFSCKETMATLETGIYGCIFRTKLTHPFRGMVTHPFRGMVTHLIR